MKYVPLEEFVRKGYLQEVNRQFLHPLGLALQVTVDNGDYILSGVQDLRHLEGGYSFENLDEEASKKKYQFVKNEAYKRADERRGMFDGELLQPIKP